MFSGLGHIIHKERLRIGLIQPREWLTGDHAAFLICGPSILIDIQNSSGHSHEQLDLSCSEHRAGPETSKDSFQSKFSKFLQA